MTEKKLDEWWGNQGFKGMENITKMKYYWFNEEDGYQEFVDVCGKWWYSMNKTDKINIYEEFQGCIYY